MIYSIFLCLPNPSLPTTGEDALALTYLLLQQFRRAPESWAVAGWAVGGSL